MFELYLLPVLIVVGIGLLAGLVLVLAAKFMAVTVDEKFELVRELLPGANCGACGYAGCDAYAEQLVAGEAAVNLCIPGGEQVLRGISNTLGAQAVSMLPRTAVVACSGNYQAVKKKMEYRGRANCAAAAMFYRGMLACDYGCLGFGDCAKACAFDAISIRDGLAVVDKRRCSGCGKCSSVCPQGVISVQPHQRFISVFCSSTDPGGKTRKNCNQGCIGCKKCEKACPQAAITVENNLARIDYELCDDCGKCMRSCPTEVIRGCFQMIID